MQQKKENKETLRRLFFAALLFGVILFLWTSGPGFDSYEEQAESWEQAQELADGWEAVPEDGEPFAVRLPYRQKAKENEPILLRRVMDRPQKAGEGLCFYTVHSKAEVWLNGQQLYRFASLDKPFGKGEPANWNMVRLPEIRQGDILTIKMTSRYRNMPRLVHTIWMGDPVNMIEYLIGHYMGQTIAALLFLTAGIALMLAAFLMKRMHQDICTFGCLGLFVLMVSMWMLSSIPMPWPFQSSTYSVIVLQDVSRLLCPIAYLLYFQRKVPERYHRLIDGMGYVLLGNFILQTIVQMAGIRDYIEMNPVNHILCGGMICVLVAIMTDWYRKDCPRDFLFYGGCMAMAVLMLSVFLEVLQYYGGSMGSGGTYLRVGLFVYLGIQTLILVREVHAHYEASEQMETEFERAKMQLMISQIKPHFIYNTLSSIRTLIKMDADRAYELVYDFSKYLRANIDSIGREDRIPFSKELEHIRAYCAIEKIRFGDRLHVEFRVGEEDFLVPPLIVQPLVENAVKHGVCKRPEGGTVVISSTEVDGYHKIEVLDDGVGFYTEADPGAGSSGIDNIRFRLERVSHAKLELTSIPQKGTKAVILIPIEAEEEHTDENHNR